MATNDPHAPQPVHEPEIHYHVPIHQWEASDRPREKLIERGPGALSDAELIGLIFGSGTRTKSGPMSAVQLGRALLRTYRSLVSLQQREIMELTRVDGIGPAKAAQLIAAFEIGRRAQSHGRGDRIQVTSPEDVAGVYGPLMRDLKKEVFKVLLLNAANVITGEYTVSEGGLASSIVEPRAVFRRAIVENAGAIICVHNHPSGNPEPSRQDVRVTRQLAEAGKVMGIALHDHVIIAGKRYMSFAERKLL